MILSKNQQQKAETDHGQGEQTWCSQGEKGRQWDGWAFLGFFACRLLHLEWMGNGILLYSTGKYVCLGHFAVQRNLMKHCKTTIF